MGKALELDLRAPHVADAGRLRQAIVGAVLNGQPARRTATRSHVASVGTFWSAKMNGTFDYESGGEFDLLRVLEVLEGVRAYRSQPLRVVYLHEGVVRRAV